MDYYYKKELKVKTTMWLNFGKKCYSGFSSGHVPGVVKWGPASISVGSLLEILSPPPLLMHVLSLFLK